MSAKKNSSRSSRRFTVVLSGLAVVSLIALVVLTIDGEGGTSSAAPVDPHTGLSEFDIPVQDPASVAAGESVFLTSCSACHGADLRGTEVGPAFLSVIYNPIHHPDSAFFSAPSVGVQAHHWGFGDMAPVAGLTEQQLIDVVAFVRENQRLEGFEPYPPP